VHFSYCILSETGSNNLHTCTIIHYFFQILHELNFHLYENSQYHPTLYHHEVHILNFCWFLIFAFFKFYSPSSGPLFFLLFETDFLAQTLLNTYCFLFTFLSPLESSNFFFITAPVKSSEFCLLTSVSVACRRAEVRAPSLFLTVG
jgi:hypothetical protein